MKKPARIAFFVTIIIIVVLIGRHLLPIPNWLFKPSYAFLEPNSSEVHFGYDKKVPRDVEWIPSPSDPAVELPYIKGTARLLVAHRRLPYRTWVSDYGLNFDDAHPKRIEFLEPGHPALPSEYQKACEDDISISVKSRALKGGIGHESPSNNQGTELVSPLTSSDHDG